MRIAGEGCIETEIHLFSKEGFCYTHLNGIWARPGGDYEIFDGPKHHSYRIFARQRIYRESTDDIDLSNSRASRMFAITEIYEMDAIGFDRIFVHPFRFRASFNRTIDMTHERQAKAKVGGHLVAGFFEHIDLGSYAKYVHLRITLSWH